ncbi:PIN domain-like protein [Bimuria novae-zelandiae CBS 107.79]|uniref:PIN domain-like protein n=1 Tax=Bimuria novae-zelandiae CBS 107.79 TaxID=1447943 RepID=A0A6A5VKS4_9PLEO|nr:PIN domain-like protein [Bimuria novae-zelandiae CBS 107.79]
MGISGLLPLLKSVQKPCSLKKFAGQTIGVDAYGWLHRGTAACAIELAQGKPTRKYVDFAMNRVRMLVHFGITPYLVFDGDYLPSKAGTENERQEKRQESKRLGLELLKVGKTSQAHLELQKSVDVTPEMARMLIEELRHHNIDYVVAPYEADSQLAYLERKGIIDGILSEDSDLLVFGAKCLITKLDKYGECVEVNRNLFTACREVSLAGWSDADFRRMAILSGCDYLPSIGGMGLKTAYRMLRKHKTVERLVKAVQFDGKFKVPRGYLESFYQAENTFLYPWVYCPTSRQLVHLTPPGSEIDIAQMTYIGAEVPCHIAYGVARGELHPHTKQPLVFRAHEKPTGKPLRSARGISSTSVTCTNKEGRPITSFFTPKRMPLAELDINLFTPSPGQQVLLEQHRISQGWAAVLAPQTSQRQPTPRAHTAPQPARRISPRPSLLRQTAPNPSKRQRLCSDPEGATPATEEGETRSRFFPSSTAEPSPSLRVTKKSRRKSSLNFELHSDDSIAEAMAAMADPEGSAPSPRKKLKVFKDSFFSTVATSDSQSTVMSSSTMATSQASQGFGTLTPTTSFGSPEPESIFTAPLSRQFQELRSKFSFGATGSSAMTTPYSSRPASARHSLASNLTSARQAAHQNETPTHSAANGASLRDLEDEILIEATTHTVNDTEVEVPASDTEDPPTRPATPFGQLEVNGSEELLIPESSDVESPCSARKPLLSLGRFAFSG